MIETADLLDMERELDRRGFIRRLFAIGAGIAATGALVRAAKSIGSHHWDYIPTPFKVVGDYRSQLICPVTQADLDKLFDSDYVRTQLVDAVNHAAPFIEVMRSKLPPTLRVVSRYEALRTDRS